MILVFVPLEGYLRTHIDYEKLLNAVNNGGETANCFNGFTKAYVWFKTFKTALFVFQVRKNFTAAALHPRFPLQYFRHRVKFISQESVFADLSAIT